MILIIINEIFNLYQISLLKNHLNRLTGKKYK